MEVPKHSDCCEDNSKARAFFDAAVKGDLETLKSLLDPTIDLDARHGDFPHDKTALHAATEHGHIETMRFLLAHGADPEVDIPLDGLTPLHVAAWMANYEAVRLLLDSGADVHRTFNIEGDEGPATFLVLRNAYLPRPNVEQRHFDIVNLLLDRGIDINTPKSHYGSGNLIQYAVRADSPDMIKMLIDRGAETNNELLLDAISWNQSVRTLQYLLDEVGLEDEGHEALQHLAFSRKEEPCEDMARILLSRETDLNVEGIYAALCDAALQANLPIIECFLEQGININGVGASGATPLLKACSSTRPGALSAVKLLLDRGADMRCRAIDSQPSVGKIAGDSVLHRIGAFRFPELMRLLLDAGADIEARNVRGETPLITFSRHLEFVSSPEPGPVTPRIEVLQLLLDSGCDVNASDGKGMTALHHLPHRRWHMATIRAAASLLIERGIDRTALDHDGREASELFQELCGMTLEDLLQDKTEATL